MNQEIFEWLLLLGRWLHITTAITWIGTSIFFMWLDRTFENGELWMVHGGGFYQVQKHQMGPTQVPEILHWFKWESYWTWMSGIFLLVAIFYAGNGTFLLDSSVSNISFAQALAISLGSVVVSWLFYDFLWESKLTKTQPLIGHALTLLWLGAMSYFLCHTLSGRAAYIHIGGMLGTWMTANVFLRIIPRQVKMVEASKKGEAVNQEWGKNAKNRSTHNTYFTLPVIFIMLSNHFPNTYGSRYNWLILLVVSAAGAAIREFFVSRLKNPGRSKAFGAIGVALLVGVVLTTSFSGRKVPGSAEIHAGDPHETGASAKPAQTPTGAAIVRGTIRFQGTPPAREKLQLPLVCAEQHSGEVLSDNILMNEFGEVENVLVRVVKGLEGKKFEHIPTETAVLDQVGCIYKPHVIAVRAGQKVEIVNSDPTFHNVKSVTKHNEDFNVAMPSKNDRITKVFDRPEIFVQTKCSVHPWMTAFIAVMDHPFYNVSGQRGEFTLENLPPGKYTIEAWHEVFGTQTKTVTVKNDDIIDMNFTFKK